jgi:hypothetical protein
MSTFKSETGTTLEDILEDLKELKNHIVYYLKIDGYTATDIENLIDDLEQQLREIEE